MRPSWIACAEEASAPLLVTVLRSMSVSIRPGAMPLTVTPRCADSRAIALVRPSTADLAAMYEALER
ncbi:hypothetical protein G6F50_018534 [Rhizopus delemar]|uniref:Uncharacterized protein n=1 Tax=Rhizopus delemar TaxID=936053 RepID=A0A9P6XLV8_9FUNG|nr:hypothetical protein G6F50_018534 [Rhizopus delemar]